MRRLALGPGFLRLHASCLPRKPEVAHWWPTVPYCLAKSGLHRTQMTLTLTLTVTLTLRGSDGGGAVDSEDVSSPLSRDSLFSSWPVSLI